MSYDFDTSKVRTGYRASEYNYVVSVSIYQTTAFALGDGYCADRLFFFSESDPIYTRSSNPTVDVPEKHAAVLHDVPGAIALTSGMAAISYVLLSAVEKGGRILTTTHLYGGAMDNLGHLFPEPGAKIDSVENLGRIGESEERLAPDIKAILIEDLANPFVTIPGLEAVTRTARVYRILLIVDNTVVAPYLFNPFEHGADIVVYSATKALSGHGNVIAGLVLEGGTFDHGNGNYPHLEKPPQSLHDEHDEPCSILQVFPQNPFTGRLRATHLNYFGAALGPFGTYLALIGLKALSGRVAKQVSNMPAVLRYLEQSRHVLWVRYSYAQGSKYRVSVDRHFPKGAGSISSFDFCGMEEQERVFLASVKVFGYQVNIGDARSLIISPVQTTHAELTEEQRLLVGLGVSTIRLSLGLENPKDLTEDLQQTFNSVFQD